MAMLDEFEKSQASSAAAVRTFALKRRFDANMRVGDDILQR
jgi:hypothetical protein